MATEKISVTWVQMLIPLLLAAGGVFFASKDHINEAQAMKLIDAKVRVEINDHAFPLSDGEVLKRDVRELLRITRENKLWNLYIGDIISKKQLDEEIDRLKKESETDTSIGNGSLNEKLNNCHGCVDGSLPCHVKG